MEKTGWKVLAIVFIILFLIETAGIAMVIQYGITSLNNEAECSVNICENHNYTSYQFDDTTNTCYCFDNGEMVYKEFIK
jgi:hypothetical protein